MIKKDITNNEKEFNFYSLSESDRNYIDSRLDKMKPKKLENEIEK